MPRTSISGFGRDHDLDEAAVVELERVAHAQHHGLGQHQPDLRPVHAGQVRGLQCGAGRRARITLSMRRAPSLLHRTDDTDDAAHQFSRAGRSSSAGAAGGAATAGSPSACVPVGARGRIGLQVALIGEPAERQQAR